MEEKAAGKLTESAERPGSLGDSTEEYVPARWTRKKIALTAAIGVVAAALSIGCAAALYLHTLDLALTGGMDAAQQDDLAEALQPPKPRADRSRGDLPRKPTNPLLPPTTWPFSVATRVRTRLSPARMSPCSRASTPRRA